MVRRVSERGGWGAETRKKRVGVVGDCGMYWKVDKVV